MKAFRFSESELQANQAGEITEKQLKRLNFGRSVLLIACPVLLVLAIGFFVWSVRAGSVLLGLITAAPFVWCIFVCLREWQKSSNDMHHPVIEIVEGNIESAKRGKGAFAVIIEINHVSFNITTLQAQALEMDDRYRVYYTRRVKQILSIQRLSEKNPAPSVTPLP